MSDDKGALSLRDLIGTPTGQDKLKAFIDQSNPLPQSFSRLTPISMAEIPRIERVSVDEQRKHMERLEVLLSQIAANTASLQDILDVAKQSAEANEIIRDTVQLLAERQKDSAEKKYLSIMRRINETCKSAETVMKLTTFLSAVYSQIVEHLK